MEFGFTPDEEAFRQEVRTFLRHHPPADFPEDGMDAGYGSGAHSYAFLRKLAEQGWFSLTWPREFGGQERPFMYRLILLEELAAAGAPFGPLGGIDQVSDAIMRYGSPRLQQEVLPRVARGEVAFWQGFSEPNSGSDLLSLQTVAFRDGDDYVLNGHKIWNSHAMLGTYGLVIARTNPDAPRHKGLSMFVVANDTPGLDIRPIRSMTGKPYHCEVFLENVRVQKDYLLGKEDEGFVQLLKGLDTDRFWGRFYKAPALQRILHELVEYANTTTRGGQPLAHNPVVRRQLANVATDIAVLRLLFYRNGYLLKEGLPTPYESALNKVFADETGQKLAAIGIELLGLYGPLQEGSRWAKLHGKMQHIYQTSLGHTIAGGTSEVLRTNVAVRGLGLPREPKVRN
jgi:alkylation response protein AidB-like acyl-CoA dehydrogenase